MGSTLPADPAAFFQPTFILWRRAGGATGFWEMGAGGDAPRDVASASGGKPSSSSTCLLAIHMPTPRRAWHAEGGKGRR